MEHLERGGLTAVVAHPVTVPRRQYLRDDEFLLGYDIRDNLSSLRSTTHEPIHLVHPFPDFDCQYDSRPRNGTVSGKRGLMVQRAGVNRTLDTG